jgi:hypothetical protein
LSASTLLALQSLGRLERAGVPPHPRLTDPDHRLWRAFQRKLGAADFVALLFQDAAQSFPVPFAHPGLLGDLSPELAADLVDQATLPPDGDSLVFLRLAARRLGRPDGGVLNSLPRIQAHERVLELPGTSGRAAAWLSSQHADLRFDTNFAFVADALEDHVLVGLAAVEARAGRPELLSGDELRVALARGRSFDRVVAHRGFEPGAALARELFPAERVLWL